MIHRLLTKSVSARSLRRFASILAGAALVLGMASVSPSALAATTVSQARGNFLSGKVGSIDPSGITGLEGAQASSSNGLAGKQTSPLRVDFLNSLNIGLPNGINLLGNNGILKLGVANQYAEANTDGSSRAAAGAVADSGGIAIGGSEAYPSDAELDLTRLLDAAGAKSALSDARVSFGALSAGAEIDANGAFTSEYDIASMKLDATSPLIGSGFKTLFGAVDAAQAGLNGLEATLRRVVPLVDVKDIPNLSKTLKDHSIISTKHGGLVLNLTDGTLHADLAAILAEGGININELGPNTDILPYLTRAISNDLVPAITEELNAFVQDVTTETGKIKATVGILPIDLGLLTKTIANVALTPLKTAIDTVSKGIGATVATPLANAFSLLLSVKANHQTSAPDGSRSVSALQLALVPSANLASLNISTATVGPNLKISTPTIESITPSNLPLTGGKVTIAGTGFVDGVTKVKLGDQTQILTPSSINEAGTSLTVDLPQHDQPGQVAVTLINEALTSNPDNVTYWGGPTITGVSPVGGPTTGGNPVVVTGSGFDSSSIRVSVDGTDLDGSKVKVDSQAQVTITMPEHAAGPVKIGLTTVGGTADADYTYYTPATFTGIAPNSGPVVGGTHVTATGTGFVKGATRVTVGGTSANNLSVESPTSLTFDTPPGTAGEADVAITTLGGTVTLPFTYLNFPTITGITPAAGPVAGGNTVTITGTDFREGDSAVFLGETKVSADRVTVKNGTTIEVTMPAHVLGGVDVTVHTSAGVSNVEKYTYVAAPTAGKLNPAAGPLAGGTAVQLTGTKLAGATVTIGGKTVTPESIADDGTSLTFRTPANDAGKAKVTVTTPGGTTDALTFTYFDAPTVTGISPTSVPQSGGSLVTVTGAGFVKDNTTLDLGGATVPVTFVSDTELTFVAPVHAPGDFDVTVTTPGGTSDPETLTYTPVSDPVIETIDPASGALDSPHTVTITGANLQVDAQTTRVMVDGEALAASEVTDVTATSLKATLPAKSVAGAAKITVEVGSDKSNSLDFTYLAAPRIKSLNPAAGPTAAHQLTVKGENLDPASLTATLGSKTVTIVSVSSDGTSAVLEIPAGDAGLTSLTLTTNGGSAVKDYGRYAPPTVDPADPNAGPEAGGTKVTLTGTGFVPDATQVTVGDKPVTDLTVANDGKSLTFKTPSGQSGLTEIDVTTPGGTATTSFRYAGTPTLVRIQPTYGGEAANELTLMGTGFIEGQTTLTASDENDTKLDVNVTSSTSGTVTLPEGAAGTITLSVTTPGGTSEQIVSYVRYPAPTVDGLKPDAGPVAGGTTSTITGSGFVSGLTQVSVGGTPAASVTVNTSTELTFVTPQNTEGTKKVTVTTPGGSADSTFTYADTPVIGGITPSAGPLAGGTSVTITGTGLLRAEISVGAVSVPASSITKNTGTELTFVTPQNTEGTKKVTVTTPGGSADGTFTYVAAPVLDEITPIHGPLGPTSVTISGSGFTGAGFAVTVGGQPAQNLTVADDGSLTLTIPAGPAGPVTIGATSAGGTSEELTYTRMVAPEVTNVSPESVSQLGGPKITIEGSGFVEGLTTLKVGDTPVEFKVVSPTEITFDAPVHAPGLAIIEVTTPGGTDRTKSLKYTAVATPALIAVNPTSGKLGAEITVKLSGSNLKANGQTTKVLVDGTALEDSRVTGVTDTELTAVLPARTSAGTAKVAARIGSFNTIELPFDYLAAPTIGKVTPKAGPIAGGTEVTVEGTGFVDDTKVTIGGKNVSPVTVDSDKKLTFTTPAGTAGDAPIVVTTNGGTATDKFAYLAKPKITDITPSAGSTGPTDVIVTGSGFSGTTPKVTVGTTVIDDVRVDADGKLHFTVPGGKVGSVDITIETPGGSAAEEFVRYAAPTAGEISPRSGPVAGGTRVTLEGSGFQTPNTSVTVGGNPATDIVVGSDTQLTFTTPAGKADAVDVVVKTPGGEAKATNKFVYQAAPTLDRISPPYVREGTATEVRLTGTGFLGDGLQVLFNGQPLVGPVAQSGTEIVVTIPPQRYGVGRLQVKTNLGSSQARQLLVTSAPKVTSVSPTRIPPEGARVQVRGRGFIPDATTVRMRSLPLAAVETNEDGTQLAFDVVPGPTKPEAVTVSTPLGEAQVILEPTDTGGGTGGSGTTGNTGKVPGSGSNQGGGASGNLPFTGTDVSPTGLLILAIGLVALGGVVFRRKNANS